MTMRLIAREIYIGDDARPIYYAGLFRREAFYIPPDDVPALERRRRSAEFLALAAFCIAILGGAERLWSQWWCVAAFLLMPLAPASTARWVRRRFEPVTNPTEIADVRRSMVLRTPTVGAAITLFGLTTLNWFTIAATHRTWIVFGVAASLFVVQVVMALSYSRERRDAEPEYVPPSTGITR